MRSTLLLLFGTSFLSANGLTETSQVQDHFNQEICEAFITFLADDDDDDLE